MAQPLSFRITLQLLCATALVAPSSSHAADRHRIATAPTVEIHLEALRALRDQSQAAGAAPIQQLSPPTNLQPFVPPEQAGQLRPVVPQPVPLHSSSEPVSTAPRNFAQPEPEVIPPSPPANIVWKDSKSEAPAAPKQLAPEPHPDTVAMQQEPSPRFDNRGPEPTIVANKMPWHSGNADITAPPGVDVIAGNTPEQQAYEPYGKTLDLDAPNETAPERPVIKNAGALPQEPEAGPAEAEQFAEAPPEAEPKPERKTKKAKKAAEKKTAKRITIAEPIPAPVIHEDEPAIAESAPVAPPPAAPATPPAPVELAAKAPAPAPAIEPPPPAPVAAAPEPAPAIAPLPVPTTTPEPAIAAPAPVLPPPHPEEPQLLGQMSDQALALTPPPTDMAPPPPPLAAAPTAPAALPAAAPLPPEPPKEKKSFLSGLFGKKKEEKPVAEAPALPPAPPPAPAMAAAPPPPPAPAAAPVPPAPDLIAAAPPPPMAAPAPLPAPVPTIPPEVLVAQPPVEPAPSMMAAPIPEAMPVAPTAAIPEAQPEIVPAYPPEEVSAPAAAPATAPEPQQMAHATPASTAPLTENALRLLFAANETVVTAEARPKLSELASQMKAAPNLRVSVVAHASGAGDQSSTARRVSLARALAVRAFLIDQGVDSLRINVQAEGSKNAGDTPDRVDVMLVAPGTNG